MTQILAIDVGTGTQDIFVLRPGLSPENGFKLVMPSPTMRIRQEIQEITRRGEPLLLTGVTMGGGPCHWAAEAHVEAGLTLYATPEAAQTFNDDLEWVASQMGVQLVSEDEARKLEGVSRVDMRDFDPDALRAAFQAFGLTFNPQVLALAVFDHGAAPPDVSDRRFRFDFIKGRVQESRQLTTFAFQAERLPQALTRMQAVRKSASVIDCPLVLMDTAPAAVLGATLDPYVASLEQIVVANIGNYHTLAFRLGPDGIDGVFEHHTGMLDQASLESLLISLADGTISNDQVFNDHGHGALMLIDRPMQLTDERQGAIVTGPRRALMSNSTLSPHFAVPLGDMMLGGCFGLLVAAAEKLPDFRSEILDTLAGQSAHSAPWDIDAP